MTITRLSAADLDRKARDFTKDENAYFDSLTDTQIEDAALADPDARPATPQMLRQGRLGRANRRAIERGDMLGVRLVEAEPGLNLPIWEITDPDGHTVLIKAADVRKTSRPLGFVTKVLKLETVDLSNQSGSERQGK